jgi:hypothetical protein
MGYHAERTRRLLAALHKEPRLAFTASQLKERTSIPKKFVRRALTIDAENVAEVAMEGVKMWRDARDGLWRFRAPHLLEPSLPRRRRIPNGSRRRSSRTALANIARIQAWTSTCSQRQSYGRPTLVNVVPMS